jgi:multiple sugar transport system substrate-binding protein
MVIGSTGGASYQTPPQIDGKSLFETGMATPPQVNPDAPKVISQGPSLCLFESENPQEVVASWLFMKFLTTNVAFQAEFSMKSGYAPVTKSVQENAVYQGWLDKASGFNNLTALSVKLALSQSDAYFVSPAFNGSSKARDEVAILMQTALVKTGDVDSAIEKLFKDAVGKCNFAIK